MRWENHMVARASAMGRRAVGIAAVGLAAGMMCAFACVEGALAMDVQQVDTAVDSVELEFTPGPQESLVDIVGIDVKTYDTEEWVSLPSEYIESLSVKGATIANLEAGSLIDQVKVRYKLKYGGSNVVTSGEAVAYDIKTVSARPERIKIAGQLFDTKKLKLSYINPGAIDGYQVKLAAVSGSKDDVSFKQTYARTALSSKDRVTTDYFGAKFNCVYKARVRTWVTIGDVAKMKKYSKWSVATVLVPQPDAWGAGSGKSAKVAWTKVKGATSYAVYASAKKSSGFKKVATVKSTSLAVTKIAGKRFAKGKKTYFYIKAVAKQGKKTYRSPAKTIFSL